MTPDQVAETTTPTIRPRREPVNGDHGRLPESLRELAGYVEHELRLAEADQVNFHRLDTFLQTYLGELRKRVAIRKSRSKGYAT